MIMHVQQRSIRRKSQEHAIKPVVFPLGAAAASHNLPIGLTIGLRPLAQSAIWTLNARHQMNQIIDRVIGGNYCIGCGACSALAPQDFTLDFTEAGMFRARAVSPSGKRNTDISALCPMSGAGPDETAVAAGLWPDLPVQSEIGRYAMTAVGWVEEDGFRARGSSGGLLSWLAAELLARGEVEEVLHVTPSAPGTDRLFAYTVSTSQDDVRKGAKSRYYPIQAQDVISHLRQSRRPALFIGLPCFVKMIRTLAEADPALRANVKYTAGLVCGHLKSSGFAEMLAWQVGVPPDHLGTVDFRVKAEGQPASRYGFAAKEAAPGIAQGGALMEKLVGRNWGQGMMKYPACDFCDDVLAECADIAVGDAWLAPWTEDWQGTNVLVARHPEVVTLLREGAAKGRLRIEHISPDQAAESQRGGLSHRREGLGWRLWKARKAGIWTPKKRVGPARALTKQREQIYDLREVLRDESHKAFMAARRENQFTIFNERMAGPLALYDRANQRPSFLRRKISGLKRRLVSLLRAQANRAAP
jgi:coenzyme F420-reducing hydrogenase beta subunit